MVHREIDHSIHRSMYETLVLLKIETATAPVYFVIEGLGKVENWDHPQIINDLQEKAAYFYEEHTCPTNFIRIPMIFHNGDQDPHGVFDFVEAVWMTPEYLEAMENGWEDDYLAAVFPQLTAVHRP